MLHHHITRQIIFTKLPKRYFRVDFDWLSELALLDEICITVNLSMMQTDICNAE
jgi:hypothetical protein